MAPVRRHLPTILLALSLPAGLAGYLLGARVVAAIAPGNALVELFVPLFIAGLCMMPFLVPWLDRRAKADLAAIQARREREAAGAGRPPADPDAPGEPDEPANGPSRDPG